MSMSSLAQGETVAPRKKPAPYQPPPTPKVRSFETFHDIGSYQINQMTSNEPSCFNGMVRVKSYRVTIEEIEEPDEVIKARIQKLWDECDNNHHREPLKSAARRYGLTLNY